MNIEFAQSGKLVELLEQIAPGVARWTVWCNSSRSVVCRGGCSPALIRFNSTVLQGSGYDLQKFQQEVDRLSAPK